MCRTEKIEHNLHRIEGSERNLNKEGVPVAQSAVPESRELKSLEFTALITLRAYEASILVHILEKVEALTLVVVEAAYDIHRIEVGS